tara:strand:+ start:7908 stop:8165 length:258 start_codon:yes stop_codon:yes gene_type:complete
MSKSNLKDNIIIAILSGLTLVLIVCAIINYLKLPIVGLNIDDECQWIRESPDFEKRVCPLDLSELKYSYERVHYDDSKGDQKEYE